MPLHCTPIVNPAGGGGGVGEDAASAGLINQQEVDWRRELQSTLASVVRGGRRGNALLAEEVVAKLQATDLCKSFSPEEFNLFVNWVGSWLCVELFGSLSATQEELNARINELPDEAESLVWKYKIMQGKAYPAPAQESEALHEALRNDKLN